MKYITDKFITFIQEFLNIIFSSVYILIIILCLKLFLNFLVPFLPLCIAFDQFEFTLCLFCFWLLCIALIIVSIYGHSVALWGSFCISVSFCVSFVILCLLLLSFEVLFATLCHLLPFLDFVWVFLPPSNDFVCFVVIVDICPASLQFCFFCLFCHISLFFLISCLFWVLMCRVAMYFMLFVHCTCVVVIFESFVFHSSCS